MFKLDFFSPIRTATDNHKLQTLDVELDFPKTPTSFDILFQTFHPHANSS